MVAVPLLSILFDKSVHIGPDNVCAAANCGKEARGAPVSWVPAGTAPHDHVDDLLLSTSALPIAVASGNRVGCTRMLPCMHYVAG